MAFEISSHPTVGELEEVSGVELSDQTVTSALYRELKSHPVMDDAFIAEYIEEHSEELSETDSTSFATRHAPVLISTVLADDNLEKSIVTHLQEVVFDAITDPARSAQFSSDYLTALRQVVSTKIDTEIEGMEDFAFEMIERGV